MVPDFGPLFSFLGSIFNLHLSVEEESGCKVTEHWKKLDWIYPFSHLQVNLPGLLTVDN